MSACTTSGRTKTSAILLWLRHTDDSANARNLMAKPSPQNRQCHPPPIRESIQELEFVIKQHRDLRPKLEAQFAEAGLSDVDFGYFRDDNATGCGGKGWAGAYDWVSKNHSRSAHAIHPTYDELLFVPGKLGTRLVSPAFKGLASRAARTLQTVAQRDWWRGAPKVAANIVRTFIPKNTTVLAVVKDGKILAQSADQVMSHSQFVNRTIGSVPEGAEVITIFKTSSGEIIANRSLTFHQNALPASQSTLDTVRMFFE